MNYSRVRVETLSNELVAVHDVIGARVGTNLANIAWSSAVFREGTMMD